jgi:hypothetical protein
MSDIVLAARFDSSGLNQGLARVEQTARQSQARVEQVGRAATRSGEAAERALGDTHRRAAQLGQGLARLGEMGERVVTLGRAAGPAGLALAGIGFAALAVDRHIAAANRAHAEFMKTLGDTTAESSRFNAQMERSDLILRRIGAINAGEGIRSIGQTLESARRSTINQIAALSLGVGGRVGFDGRAMEEEAVRVERDAEFVRERDRQAARLRQLEAADPVEAIRQRRAQERRETENRIGPRYTQNQQRETLASFDQETEHEIVRALERQDSERQSILRTMREEAELARIRLAIQNAATTAERQRMEMAEARIEIDRRAAERVARLEELRRGGMPQDQYEAGFAPINQERIDAIEVVNARHAAERRREAELAEEALADQERQRSQEAKRSQDDARESSRLLGDRQAMALKERAAERNHRADVLEAEGRSLEAAVERLKARREESMLEVRQDRSLPWFLRTLRATQVAGRFDELIDARIRGGGRESVRSVEAGTSALSDRQLAIADKQGELVSVVREMKPLLSRIADKVGASRYGP